VYPPGQAPTIARGAIAWMAQFATTGSRWISRVVASMSDDGKMPPFGTTGFRWIEAPYDSSSGAIRRLGIVCPASAEVKKKGKFSGFISEFCVSGMGWFDWPLPGIPPVPYDPPFLGHGLTPSPLCEDNTLGLSELKKEGTFPESSWMGYCAPPREGLSSSLCSAKQMSAFPEGSKPRSG